MHWKEWLHQNPDEKLEIIEQLVIDNAVMVDAARMSSLTTATLARVLDKLITPPENKMRPVLAFNLLINNTNFNFMAVVKNLTLTSTAPVTLNMTVTDGDGGPEIAGVLSGLSYAPADPAQDIAVVDPAVATEVDVHAVTNTGGTTVTGSGSFTSTLLGVDGKTPAFTGTVTGQLILVNNIPVKVLNPVLAFNQ